MADQFMDLLPKYSEGPGFSGPDAWPESTSEYERNNKKWLHAALEECQGDQAECDELQHVNEYIEYLHSKQWKPGLASYKAKPVNNRMVRNYWELVGLLTDIRPISEVKTAVGDDDPNYKQFIESETAINKGMKAWWVNNDIDLKLALCISWAVLTTSFAKFMWNPNLNMGRGDLDMVPVGPNDLLMLKPKFDLQSSEAVILQSVESVGSLKRKYPKRAYLIQADPSLSQYAIDAGTPSNMSSMQYKHLSAAMQRMVGGEARMGYSSYPMARVKEFWLRDHTYNTSNVKVVMGNPDSNWHYTVEPGKPLYPRGRLMVMAGSAIIHDGPNPYWHGMFPFGMLRLNVVPWQIYGMSMLKSWADLQDIVNQIYAGVLNMIKKAVNPTLYAPKTAFTPDQWDKIDTGMPGLRLAYNQQTPGEPKFITPPPLPGFVMSMLMQVEREMDQQSGMSTVSEMMKKKQVPSGDTMDMARNILQGPVRLQGRNIEVFVRNGGQIQLSNMLQFYGDSRRLHIPGATAAAGDTFTFNLRKLMPEKMTAFEFARTYNFYLQEGSLLAIQRVQKQMELYRLRMMGDLDRKTFFKLMDYGLDVNTIEKNLAEERQKGIGAMPQKKGSHKGGDAQNKAAAQVQ